MYKRQEDDQDEKVARLRPGNENLPLGHEAHERRQPAQPQHRQTCLLYTSDAADERSSVDLGGRRIIKKTTPPTPHPTPTHRRRQQLDEKRAGHLQTASSGDMRTSAVRSSTITQKHHKVEKKKI